MSEWITDRRPLQKHDGAMVYGPDGEVCHFTWIHIGDPWKPIPKCEPYVKPKRWRVTTATGGYIVYDGITSSEVADNIPTREAAERIAAIYEEVMP